jgi:carboxyl-terminal processing protease
MTRYSKPQREPRGTPATPLLLFAFLASLASAQISSAQISTEQAPTRKSANKILAEVAQCVDARAFALGVDFSDISTRLDSARPTIDAAATEGEFARRVNEILDQYGISHLMLVDPQLAKLSRRGDEVGAGLKAALLDSGQRLVTVVLPDSPASAAGLRAGDTITAVDRDLLTRESGDSHLFSLGGRLLPGASESRTLTWQRDGVSKETALQFARHASSLPLELRWENDSIAWLTINSFKDYDARAVEKRFAEIRDRRARGLILDMRSNGGGYSTSHQHLASLLIPDGTSLYRSIEAEGQDGSVMTAQGSKLDFVFEGPLVILVDGTNGSGGELFPAYMRETRKATIVGTRTNGAVLGAIYCDVSKGFRTLVPIHEVIPMDGKRIEGQGVAPDITLTAAETANDARIRQVALSVLRD